MGFSLLIVTGQSGSGKSTAVRALEDQSYFCVDNIPTSLVEPLIEVIKQEHLAEHLALVMDMRDRHFPSQAPELIARLRQGHDPVRLLFLEAQEESVIRRYSETRRLHPLDRGHGLRQAIVEERALLESMRELADDTIDTSGMSPHVLRTAIIQRLADANVSALRVGLLSFGFRYGVPTEADMIFDVRFLRNPYFDAKLRPQTGEAQEVFDFVVTTEEAQAFLQHTDGLLGFLVPQYQKEGKHYLTVAVGCTGGRHRSVAMVREMARRLAENNIIADLRHRDVGIEN